MSTQSVNNKSSGNRSVTNSGSLNLTKNTGSANSQLLNNKLSGPNSMDSGSSRGNGIYGQLSNRNLEPASNGNRRTSPNSNKGSTDSQLPNTLLGPNRVSSQASTTSNIKNANKQNEESFLTNLFGTSSENKPSNKGSLGESNKESKKNNSGNGSEESGFLENLFGGSENNQNKSKASTNANANGNTNNSKKSESTNKESSRKNNTSVVNSTRSAVSEGLESIKTAASGLANQVSHKLEEVTEASGMDSGNLMMTILKIVIALLVIIAVFFVARYLLGKYQDSVYSSPYLLEGSKNAKHALVVSQDPVNPSYVPMPKSDGQDGIQFTYDFWIMIESFEYKTGEWKHVFHKGNASSYPNRAPGVWIHPNTNALRVYMNTQDNILEYVDVANVPIRKWIHMAIVLDDMNLDVYVNGYLKTRRLLTSVPKLNNGDFWCNMFGGFEGYLSKIRYYARAIGPNEIAENVRSGPGNSACIDTGQVPPYLDDDWWLS
jgi:hypothetical protein